MLKRTIAAALALLCLAVPAGAQYFGRNKVQYDRFDFAILQTSHFDIYYYPQERAAVQLAARMAERWYERLSVRLGHTFDRRQPLILYASHTHFSETSIIPGEIAEGVGGFTDHNAGRIVLPFAAGLGETDHVLGHEIVHAFQRDILRQRGRSLAMLPLWFAEGMAEYLSVGGLDANTQMWLRDAAASGKLPTIAQLQNPRYFPYRFGQGLWAFLDARFGDAVVVKALKSRAPGGAAGRLQDATGQRVADLTREWHQFIRELPAPHEAAGAVRLHRIIGGDPASGRMNVGPSLSPNGRYLVFLSERDGYAVDVFLADATTGNVVRKLLSMASDPHFESLQFIDSSGAWDAEGRRFALAAVRDGRPVLAIFDMPEGTLHQEIAIPGVDQIFNPTWSPDAAQIAFGALKGGLTDLYAVRLANGDVRALTSDPYSDLHPSWSPDGRMLVFATDRFSSSLDALTFGRYELATLDLESDTVSRLGGTPGGKSVDPHWSPDGRTVYFVSDASGASNVERLDVATGLVTPITAVTTGISGITALSPAISISGNWSRLAASVYEKGVYEIRTLAPPAVGAPPIDNLAVLPAHTLVPPIAASSLGGGEPASFVSKPYVPRLSLATIGQPYMSAGGGAFGSFLRAGVSFTLGDMLGQQYLDTAVQVGKSIDDFAVQAAYTNRRSRWNWGLGGGQVPWLTGLSQSLTTNGNGEIVRQSATDRQIHRQVSGAVAYPFSRSQRLEVSAGFDATTYDRELTSTRFSATTGARIGEDTTTATSMPGAKVAQLGAAFVYDTAVDGPTSPVMGQRYRFSFAPSFGDLHLLTAAADYRRYFMPARDLTIATRFEHVVRFGADNSDPRLLPLVWWLRDFVRGYDDDPAIAATPQFTLGNVEMRLPLTSMLRADHRPGQLPIEAFAFTDAGRFTITTPSDAAAGARVLWSAGVGARLNAAGFVFEFDAVRPISPASGWRLSVNFRPGF